MRITNNFNTTSTLKIGKSNLFSLNGRFLSNPAATTVRSAPITQNNYVPLQKSNAAEPTQKPQRRGCASCRKRR